MLGVASTKKYDKMLGADSSGTVGGVFIPPGNVTFTMWAPATREFQADETGPADRNRWDVFFVGFKDMVYFELVRPIIWRRVVFWTHERYEWAQSVLNSSGDYFRRVEPQTVLSQPDFINDLLQGDVGRDYENRFMFDSKIDNRRNRVVYDRKITVNVGNDSIGKIVNFKRWHDIRRLIQYDDAESGGDIETQVWAVDKSGTSGNLYVLDMFHMGLGSTGNDAFVRYESDVYWHEH